MPNTVEHAMGKIIALSLSGFLIGVDMLITSVAIAPMSKDLHASISAVQWFMSGYGIGVAFFLIPAGKIADIIGHRRMNIIRLLIFGFASAGITLSQHSITMIIASIIEGMGGATILVSGITLILQNFPEEKRGSVMGFIIGTSGFGMACGPIVGGLLIHYFNWHVAFAINLPISVITVFLVLHYFSKSAVHSENNKVDIPGFCLLTLTLILLIVGISRGHYWHWDNSKTITCFIIAALLLLTFIIVENRTKHPLIEFSMFRIKNFLAANIAGFFAYFTTLSWLFIFSLFLQRVYHFSPMKAGIALLPFSLIYFFCGLIARKLMRRLGEKNLILIGFVFSIIGVLLLAFIHLSMPYWILAIGFALIAFAFASIVSASIPVMMQYVPAEKAGVGSGEAMMFRWFGASIGVAVLAVILESKGLHYLQLLYQHSTALSTLVSFPQLAATLAGTYHLQPGTFSSTQIATIHHAMDLALSYGVRICMITLIVINIVALLITMFSLHKTVSANTNKG